MNKHSVLIIDDEEDMCDILEEIFKSKGFSAHSAQCGKDALEATRSMHFDVVLVDLLLDDMDGISIAKAIQKKHHDTLIFLMTGFTTDKRLNNIQDSGITRVFQKPFDIESMVTIITDELKRQNKS